MTTLCQHCCQLRLQLWRTLWYIFIIGTMCGDNVGFVRAQNDQETCASIGMCGELEKQTETPCVAHHPPKKVSEEYMEVLQEFCPELTKEHGTTLCCGDDVIQDLSEKLGLAQTFIGKCPACLKNLRAAVCHLMCAPNHLRFLNLTKGQPVPPELAGDSDGDADTTDATGPAAVKHYVTQADLYLDSRFGIGAYESCKNVIIGAVGGNIMDLMCGKWKSAGCNPRRFFDNVGKAAAGMFGSMEARIHLIEEEQKENMTKFGVEPFYFKTMACNEEIAEEGVCACLDCVEACPVMDPPVRSNQDTFFQTDDMYYTMTAIGVTGSLAILIAGIRGHMSRRNSASSDLTNGETEMQAKGDQNGTAEKHNDESGEQEKEDIVTKVLREIATCKQLMF